MNLIIVPLLNAAAGRRKGDILQETQFNRVSRSLQQHYNELKATHCEARGRALGVKSGDILLEPYGGRKRTSLMEAARPPFVVFVADPPPLQASGCPQVSLQRNARVTTERKARVWDADGTLEVASRKSTPYISD